LYQTPRIGFKQRSHNGSWKCNNSLIRLPPTYLIILLFPHPPLKTLIPLNEPKYFIGTFQKVEHVFVCGAGGGVPHYTNYDKHVKLGDVVVSHCGNNQK